MWKKRKKVILASLGSVLIHLAVLLAVALLIALASPDTPGETEEPPKPLEVEITHVPEKIPPPLPAPTARRYVDIDPSDLATATTPPPDAQVEGDRNAAASSELPPSGDQDMFSQKGKVAPAFAFESHPHAPDPAAAAAAAAPTPVPETEPPRPQPDRTASQPQSTPPPEAAVTPAPTPKDDEFAMLDPTPTPAPPDFDPSVRPPDDTPPIANAPTPPPPRKPAGGAAEQEKTQINGNVANSGASSLAMMATPAGAYKKAVTDAIKTRWYAYINARLDTASYGTVTVHFFIDRSGKVLSPHIVANSGNEALASASMQAIIEAHIPPIPDDVASGIKDEVMPLDFDFTLY